MIKISLHNTNIKDLIGLIIAGTIALLIVAAFTGSLTPALITFVASLIGAAAIFGTLGFFIKEFSNMMGY